MQHLKMKTLLAVCVAISIAGVYCDAEPKIENEPNSKKPSFIHNKLDQVEVYDGSDGYKLELVQVLFRHGDRIPAKEEIYPTDPYDAIFASHGFGQLTKTGMQREYRIGQVLRKRYDKFLGDFNNSDVFAYSTNIDRTKMSLQLALNGLYPPSTKSAWNDDVGWIPIPTHYEAFGADFLMGFACKQYKTLFKLAGHSDEIQEKIKNYHEFYKHLRNATNTKVTTPFSAYMIYCNLHAAKSLGLSLPGWCSEDDYNTLKAISAISMQALTLTDSMKRTMAGLIIEKFLKNIYSHDAELEENDDEHYNDHHEDHDDENVELDAKAKKKTQKKSAIAAKNRKIYLFAAHDLNVAPFTNVHNFTGIPKIPDYGTTVIVEKLRGEDKQVYIRFFYWTGVSEEWIPLKLEKCEKACLLSDYEKIVQSLMPDDFARRCHSFQDFCIGARPTIQKVDVSFQLYSLYAGKDLDSFKYMHNVNNDV